jgi:hypothetical protein
MAKEKEWARAIARDVSAALPEVVREVPGLKLTGAQVASLQKAFENHLVRTMGENRPGVTGAGVKGGKKG